MDFSTVTTPNIPLILFEEENSTVPTGQIIQIITLHHLLLMCESRQPRISPCITLLEILHSFALLGFTKRNSVLMSKGLPTVLTEARLPILAHKKLYVADSA